MKRRPIYGFAGLCCVTMAGCYQKVAEDGGLVFKFQVWVPLLVALVGVALVPAGLVILKRKQLFWGIALVVAGPIAAIALAPGMYLDRVVVNQEGFSSRHGFWWSPTIHEVRYQDLAGVKLVVEEKMGRRGKTYSYYFDCAFKSGKQERVPLGDIMREALPEIAGHFREHGVPIDIPADLPE